MVAARKAGGGSVELQSTLEYLMTYGWAILASAIIVAVLYYLGIFGSANLAPKAPPGSCQVYRAGGIGSDSYLNTEGICNNLLPEYVLQARGVGGYVSVNGSNTIASRLNLRGNNITIAGWVLVKGSPYHDVIDKENQYGMKIDYNNYPHACTPSNSPGFCLEWDTTGNWIGQSFPIPGAAFGKWMFLAVSMQGNEKYWYANGAEIGSSVVTGNIAFSNANFTIGAISEGYNGYGEAEWFNGSLSNMQLYNASLSPVEITGLYDEGVGGVPIDLQYLVGWWPLNGNGDDYSGNADDGRIVNQTQIDTWSNQYNPP